MILERSAVKSMLSDLAGDKIANIDSLSLASIQMKPDTTPRFNIWTNGS